MLLPSRSDFLSGSCPDLVEKIVIPVNTMIFWAYEKGAPALAIEKMFDKENYYE